MKIPYGKQHITEEDIKAVVEVLKSEFLTQGPKVREFEEEFAKFTGAKYAVAVANGTAALHLAYKTLGVNENSIVVSTPITFSATTNGALYNNGKVIFADIDPETALIDLNYVEDLAKKLPVSVVAVVDFAGNPVNLEELKFLSDKYGFKILEDACHAPGAYFYDSNNEKQLTGNCKYADVGIFSFHPVKHIAAGEGGIITTNNPEIYKKLLYLRTHGITKDPKLMRQNDGGWYYEMIDLGFNYRLTDIQAALGLSQLKRIEPNLQRRQEIAKKYTEAFKDLPITPLKTTPNSFNAYHLFVIKTPKRKELYDHLVKNQIFAQIHYIPVHLLPYYRENFGWKKGDLPKAEKYYEQCISLPMFHSLTDEEQNYVIQKVREFFN